MIKKIIKAVNVVFGNFVRVQSRLSFDVARKYLQEIILIKKKKKKEKTKKKKDFFF